MKYLTPLCSLSLLSIFNYSESFIYLVRKIPPFTKPAGDSRFTIEKRSDFDKLVWKFILFASFLLCHERITRSSSRLCKIEHHWCSLKWMFRYRRQAFDANMTRDYVLDSVSMDNPQLVAYIRQVHLKPTTHQDPLNANQTSEEKYVASLSQGKREGIYAEYISRVRNLSFQPSGMWLMSHVSLLRTLRVSSF